MTAPARLRLAAAGTALLALAACMQEPWPLSAWYRAGIAPGVLDRAQTACEVEAAQQVPVSTQIRTMPSYTTPTRTDCTSDDAGNTTCVTTGGETRGGDVVSYDANTELRQRVIAQCMGAQGYSRISLPRCTDDQLAGRSIGYQQIPDLSPGACAARAVGGGTIFVNPQ
ncbi:hypothetical protein [Wenxinia saemankumensis]|uniref:Uncharacterized protein n=1 Tax=Wenxinia saemankumensis TaxID=1447782 RepID=A0A1M6E0U4_9RHOB|nr:hypothetical protein [Wenxinia saemankumensis]SHI79023.1 hypothetical protein SAMN05444417_1725 [Wenxinia saemankumensis]